MGDELNGLMLTPANERRNHIHARAGAFWVTDNGA